MAVSQRVVAGVSIDERLAIGAYGAIHKAHTASRRDLRALMVDAKLAAEAAFSAALLDDRTKALLTSFDHPSVVPTLSIAKTGDELVVVTVGPGKHATVSDLLAGGRKLTVEVTGSIAQAVAQALAAAHQRGLVHGAVHPRSVVIDDAGHVKLCDFAVGRALTAAVARGASGQLARGLTGTLAPEVAIGEQPSPEGDVYACGALIYTMLTGELPPGPLRITPAVERVVSRALDVDPGRRFRHGGELLEALLEAYDDDRWAIADAGELRKLVAARAPSGSGAATDGNLDEDTEDLLASLGSAAKSATVTRQAVDERAAAAAEKPRTKGNLDALLADLDPKEELTAVDATPPRKDPISEIIRLEEARKAKGKGRPGGLPLPDHEDHTPLPPPAVGDDDEPAQLTPAPLAPAPAPAKPKRPSAPGAPRPRSSGQLAAQHTPAPEVPRGVRRSDEMAALTAIAELDDRPASEPPVAKPAPAPAPARPKPAPQVVQRARPASAVDPIAGDPDAPAPRLKSRFWPIVWTLIVLGGGVVAVKVFLDQRAQNEEQEERNRQAELNAQQQSIAAEKGLDDPGNVVINSEPNEGSVWLLLGRTPMKFPAGSASVAFGVATNQLHEIRIELDGYTPIDTQIPGNLWSLDQGADKLRVAKLDLPLKVAKLDRKGRPEVVLGQQPVAPPPAVQAGPFPPGKGVIDVTTTPAGAAVWLFLGTTNGVRFSNLIAGKSYEFRVLKDGFLPAYIRIDEEEWRNGGDPKLPMGMAPKHETLTRSATLAPDPKAGR
jgi:serine/threonine protein kinase